MRELFAVGWWGEEISLPSPLLKHRDKPMTELLAMGWWGEEI
jgi:hypothetical protein